MSELKKIVRDARYYCLSIRCYGWLGLGSLGWRLDFVCRNVGRNAGVFDRRFGRDTNRCDVC